MSTILDVIPERDVAVRGAAAGEDRRVAGFELGLHLRLLVGSGVDVPVGVDEVRAWHSCPLASIDLQPLRVGRAGGHGHDLPAAHDHRARRDHRAVSNDHVGIRDRNILSRQIFERRARQCPGPRGTSERGRPPTFALSISNLRRDYIQCRSVRHPALLECQESRSSALILPSAAHGSVSRAVGLAVSRR